MLSHVIKCCLITITTCLVNYDMYVFSRSWIPGFCEFNTQGLCQNGTIGNQFTIHGLWPNWKNGSWPQYCNNSTLDRDILINTMPDMCRHWSDNGKPDWDLWSHEWYKHGTCSIGNLFINNCNDYFTTGLWLDMKLNANYKLLSSNILPSVVTSYKKKDIIDIIGATPICKKKGDKYILTEVRNYISLNFQNITLPDDDMSCGDDIYVIPYVSRR